jgi:glycosyltransferase involved in cell wall biosynthesis
MTRSLTYAIVTPARDEAEHLGNLARCLSQQTVEPDVWVIADNGSRDATGHVAAQLAAEHSWVRSAYVQGVEAPLRGGPVVHAFASGLELVDPLPDVVVKLDADVTMEPDYFGRLLGEFARDPALGIASGVCHEFDGNAWLPHYGTRSHVWGAARAYRRACLEQVTPLEERQGWDEIDAIKAQVRGWRVGTLLDLPFRHHRAEGARGGSYRHWADQGDTAHYMGYRFSYLLFRTFWRIRNDPVSIAMLLGYVRASLRGSARCADADVRRFLQAEQSMRKLPLRLREALGRT